MKRSGPFTTGYARAQWAREVVRGTNLSPSARHVLLLLTSYADDRGECWPSMERELCPSTGLSARTIRRAVAELKTAGALDVEYTPRLPNGQRATNRYRLLITGGHGRPAVTTDQR